MNKIMYIGFADLSRGRQFNLPEKVGQRFICAGRCEECKVADR